MRFIINSLLFSQFLNTGFCCIPKISQAHCHSIILKLATFFICKTLRHRGLTAVSCQTTIVCSERWSLTIHSQTTSFEVFLPHSIFTHLFLLILPITLITLSNFPVYFCNYKCTCYVSSIPSPSWSPRRVTLSLLQWSLTLSLDRRIKHMRAISAELFPAMLLDRSPLAPSIVLSCTLGP